MRLQFWQHGKTNISYSVSLKCGAIFLLFLLSVLIVACGSNASDTNLGQPAATVTINLDQSSGSPTPPLPGYTCSAWVTNTSPGINTTSIVGVYAKFVHNLNGNPEGVYPASGTATVLWPDGNTVNVSANTTPDGLAVFPVSIANRAADLNKLVMGAGAVVDATGSTASTASLLFVNAGAAVTVNGNSTWTGPRSFYVGYFSGAELPFTIAPGVILESGAVVPDHARLAAPLR